jgi:hypothetical protein
MPERMPADGNDRTEQLNLAIDRMLAGEAGPPLADPELSALLHLAERLSRELPQDLPDPAFKMKLKDELTARYPVVTPLPQPSRGRVSRFPYAAVSAIAAVFIAAIVVGGYAIWGGDSGSDSSTRGQLVATLQSATSTVPASTLTIATESSSQVTAFKTQQPTDTPQPTATASATSGLTVAPTKQPTDPAPTPTSPATQPAETPTLPTNPTVRSTTPALASLPAVDARTIEQGAVPAAEGGGPGPSSGVTFEMNAPTHSLAASAVAYHLAPPDTEPEAFCKRVADQLNIGDDITSSDASGQLEYFAGNPDSGTFHWVPATGVFQFSSAIAPGAAMVDEQGALSAARAWLTSIGYPVDLLAGTGTVEPLGEQWQVETDFQSVPAPGVGRPIGTWVLVNPDGSIAEANGYWLTPEANDQVALIGWDDAWSRIQHGDGYWLDGGMSAEGGTFTVDTVELSYVLTRTDVDLVLQPVVKVSGTFVDASGASDRRIAVFVQAAQATATSP